MQRQPGKRPASFAAMIDQSQNILLAEISQNCGERHTKTDIVVPVVRVVVVADRDTSVVFIVVPRAAPQTL